MTKRRGAKTANATPLPPGPALVTRVGAALAVTLLGCGPGKRTHGPPPELPPQRDQPPQVEYRPDDRYAQPPPDAEDVGPVPPQVAPPQVAPPQVAPPQVAPPQVAPPQDRPPPPQPPQQVRPPQVRPPQARPPQVRPPQLQSPPPMIPQAPQTRKAPQVHRAPVRPDANKVSPDAGGEFPAAPPPLVGPFDRKKR